MNYKSPEIHRTPLYRAKSAYVGMFKRCLNRDGKSPTYRNVELRMTREEWISWALPFYEEFIRMHPDESPNAARIGDKGHYEIGNIRIVTVSENQAEQAARGIGQLKENGTKRCSTCKAILSSDYFAKNRSRKDGLSSNCKECHKKFIKNGKPNGWKPRKEKAIEHGTRAGYLMEAYRDIQHCDACREANRIYSIGLRNRLNGFVA